MAAIQLVINNRPHEVEIAPDNSAVEGAARQTQHDGYQVWLRDGLVRSVHGSSGRRGGAILPDAGVIGRREKDHDH